jgi:hypothetical protein
MIRVLFHVVDCRHCGNLHVVRFEPRAGIDGDYVCDCPEAGTIELHRSLIERTPGRPVTRGEEERQ